MSEVSRRAARGSGAGNLALLPDIAWKSINVNMGGDLAQIHALPTFYCLILI